MKILYGVQGTGNGHISRARAISKHLCNTDAQVDYLFSGRDREAYFDMEGFGDWQCRSGLSFVSKAGKISTLATIRSNNLWQLYRDICELDLSAYDLVISDFEPVTAWAARRQKKNCITLGHQYAFQHDIPITGDSFSSRLIIRHFAPGQQQLGLHWHHFGAPILPPIIDHSEDDLPSIPNKILVYLGFEAPAQVIPLLQQFPSTQFVYYGEFDQPSEQGNVSLRPLSVDGFKRDLADCSGVICNAGFELASEALHIGKRLLVKPLHGQMEQLSNALALEQLRLGSSMQNLSAAAIGSWLKQHESPRCHYPDVAKAIVDWLLEEQRCPIDELSRQLWSQVKLSGVDWSQPQLRLAIS
ncbi:glycosyltransferase [Pseudomaricurvus alkylphenolicus]|jgi:uncharacterized protein (TIGR00661 family)|uniref:MJ1255/VC2487 family glycosyltransferase n=1 Tax=Pseudomaricurvus alkylphenolicus TaxID=1306991 RepID=UPI00141DBB8F|nr:MJ1255/VC2487 family glycosyltransferase [Pseudomaricurvus alkylphenolicus]NIB41215.1 glycosyltransferase [Pseudomaricurvus alkylphenolicus]